MSAAAPAGSPAPRRWRAGPAVALLAAVAALGACAPQLQPRGPNVGTAELLADRYRAADGVELPLRRWLPEGPPKAVILALHGFNDYSNAFAAPAALWAQEGIATYAYDQRGFGATPGAGLWPGVAALTADLRTVARLVKRRHQGTPFYLLGDSMGAAVVLAALGEAGAPPPLPQADGVILVAPAVWARQTMNPLQRGLLWIAAHTVPWLRVSGRGLRIRASDNVAMLRALSEDPLVIKESRIDTIYGLANLMDRAMESASELSLPTLILYGEHDEIIPRPPIEELLRRLPSPQTVPWRAAFYRRGYHMLLRDLEAYVVNADIVVWIGDRRARLPSAADRGEATVAGMD